MLENEPNKFKDENFPPVIKYSEREQLIQDVILYFVNIKSIFMDLEYSKEYKTSKVASQKMNLKETHLQSLRKLFKEFSKFDFIVKIYEGNLFNSKTEVLFKKLHRAILNFEKMPTRKFNFEWHVRKLLDPIMEHLKDMSTLTDLDLDKEKLAKPQDEN